jgi:hypothetical protein
MSATNPRAAYIDGLRALASVLEAHPEVPLPYEGTGTEMAFHFLHGADPRAAMAETARALPCAWRKETRDYEDGTAYFDLHGQLAGLKVRLCAYRDAVCTRVKVGTREVTETVKDPAALAGVPEVEVTRTEDIVTWDCGSLLAPAAADAAKAVTA